MLIDISNIKYTKEYKLDILFTMVHNKVYQPLLITTIVLICFISLPNHCYWELNVCLNIKNCKYMCSDQTNMSNFRPLEVVGRDSETQLQVGANLKKITLYFIINRIQVS